MGFPESQARQALDLCQGNIDMAVDRILSGHAVSATSSFTGPGAAEAALVWPSREEEGDIVQAANGINQYSFSDGGSSACTCIALHVASSALEYLNNHHQHPVNYHHSHNNIQNDEKTEGQKSSANDKNTVPEARKFFTAERLQSLLCHGVEMYRVLKNGHQQQQGIGSSSLAVDTDHFSPEDVLALLDSTTTLAQWNVSLKLLDCGIKQGLLRRRDINDAKSSHQRAEPAIMGLKEILDDCHHLVSQQQEESLGGNEWMCAIITKPPETICVLLPPLRKRDDSFQETQPFILVDSHPRPGLGIEGAYAKFHSSLDSLVTTLSTDIFPFTDLGNDDDNEAGDWMTAMYNSFDLYPFTFWEGGRK